MEYPKIETIFNRDPEDMKHVVWGDFRHPAFETVSRWTITEKVDGTNVRIFLTPDQSACFQNMPAGVSFGGRTKNAQMQTSLLTALTEMFPLDLVASAFDPDTTAILFGEGYGPKIQKGGGLYRSDGPSFRLFDVVVFGTEGRPWWLEWSDVEDVAQKLGIETVPVLALGANLEDAFALTIAPSTVAYKDGGEGCNQEGIVARSEPTLFDRRGRRVMWKLKESDIP